MKLRLLFCAVLAVMGAQLHAQILPSTPVFTQNYIGTQSVSITSAGATSIYYTTDGSTPTTGSTLYSGPLSLAGRTLPRLRLMLSAIGVNAGGSSPVATGNFRIILPPSTPVFAPPPGIYNTAQSVTITSSGSTAVYYTTDGSTPTAASTLYAGPVFISTATTLSAMGVNAAGSSPVTSGAYTGNFLPQIILQPAFAPIHSFTGGNGGGDPNGLMQGTDGRLYGTASAGGANGYGVLFAVNPDGTGFTILHSFTGGNDGLNPNASLIQGSDGRLYGTTVNGGAIGYGVLFAVNSDGANFTTLHSFMGGNDGAIPLAGFIQGSDGRLYGTANEDGANNNGILFAVNSDGTNFTTLYSFMGGNDGASPAAGLIQGSDGRLYGTASGGGANGDGTVFAVNPDGTRFTPLHSFTGGNDGANPHRGLIQGTDGRLYGTDIGGTTGNGTLFAINPDGTGFTRLYNFTGGNDGGDPNGLIQGTDGWLYGTAFGGGANGDNGTVFVLHPDGTGFTTLYGFTGGNDGSNPLAGLIQGSDGRLYGTASGVSTNGYGTVFAISSPTAISGKNVTYSVTVSGTAPFSYQWQFNGVNIPGATSATLNLSNVNASNSGSYTVVVSNAYGSVTSNPVTLTVIVPPSTPVFAPPPGVYGGTPLVSITSAGATSIYYTTDGSTPTTASTLYSGSVAISNTARLRLSAIGVNAGGSSPVAIGIYRIISPPSAPIFSPVAGTYTSTQSVTITSSGAGAIYYTTDGSTPTTSSTLYSYPVSISTPTTLNAIGVNLAGSSPMISGAYTGNFLPQIILQPAFALIHSFTSGNDGGYPDGLMQGTDGRLYGTTVYGGISGCGTVFVVNPDGTGFTTLYRFAGGNDGMNPNTGLIQGSDGRLYGTTVHDGAIGAGVVFAINSDGTNFTALSSFTGVDDGVTPMAGLIQGSDGRLYGTNTNAGGGNGCLFAVNSDGTNYTTLYNLGHSFMGGNDGAFPVAGLIQGSDGRLYGTASRGGAKGDGTLHAGDGTVFAVNPDGTNFTVLHSFTGGNDGATPQVGLIQGTDGRLYGTTVIGGTTGNGTLFAINPDGTGLTVLYSFTSGNDGATPQVAPIQGTDGQLYGTTVIGGITGNGTLFAINTDGTGLTALYSFSGGNDGGYPSGLIQGTDGRLYGTASGGGANGGGTLFAVSSPIATAGKNVTYSVTVTGTAPFSYQWQFNGVNIPGATSATLNLSNVNASNSGSYTVVVSNAYGSVASNAAMLTVHSSPSAPVFAPAAGTYGSAQSVSVTSTGATSIYYTTDGSTPTIASTLYAGPVLIARITTFRAIGVNASGSGPVTSGTYTINLPTLPYLTDFEASEDYILGSLNQQLGWSVSQGSASVTNQDAEHGTQSVVLQPSTPPAQITQTFAAYTPPTGPNIIFVDFYARPVAEATGTTGTTFNAGSATFYFQLTSPGQGTLYAEQAAFNNLGSNPGTETPPLISVTPTNFTVPLGTNNQSQNWIRLTARLDFIHQTWDLYANGAMVAADLNFLGATSPALINFTVQGDAATASEVDDIFAGPQNPLFADVNNDGIDDAWETANGLSLSVNDRYLYLELNGSDLTVLQQFINSANPANSQAQNAIGFVLFSPSP